VFAFEADPRTAEVTKDHFLLNQIENATVVPQAISDREGTIDFFIGGDHRTSSLVQSWVSSGNNEVTKAVVCCTTLDHFFNKNLPGKFPDFIKMDIEGAGTLALKGCDACFRSGQPYVLIESHTPDEDKAISETVLKYDYSAFRLSNWQWVKKPALTHPDADGIWGSLFLVPRHLVPIASRYFGKCD
jgi:FkbM family methyltransferase